MEQFWADIRKNLTDHFSLDEIKNICFDFDVDYENLDHTKKHNLARELLSQTQRRFEPEKKHKLYRRLSQERLNIVWPEWPLEIYEPEKAPVGPLTKVQEPPREDFDSSLLKKLRSPGGAMRTHDKFYVERPEDEKLKEAITDWGETITIRAPRQAGKTSMLYRALQHAENEDIEIIFFDFQEIGSDALKNKDIFLHHIASEAAKGAGISKAAFQELWDRDTLSQTKLTALFHELILPKQDKPLILAIDEADEILSTNYSQDIFGLIRSWHNRRAREELWESLNIVLIISTEPYLLIDDISQSPFNVGLRLNLDDFNQASIKWLNKVHDSPLTLNQLKTAHSLLGGQPYLIRKIFYDLVKGKKGFEELCKTSIDDNGPFGDHLRRHLGNFKDQQDLATTFKQIATQGYGQNSDSVIRLSKAGLVQQTENGYKPRCELYAQYFGKKLA